MACVPESEGTATGKIAIAGVRVDIDSAIA